MPYSKAIAPPASPPTEAASRLWDDVAGAVAAAEAEEHIAAPKPRYRPRRWEGLRAFFAYLAAAPEPSSWAAAPQPQPCCQDIPLEARHYVPSPVVPWM